METISGVKGVDVIGKIAFDVFPFLKDSGEDKYFRDALAGKTTISENRSYTVPETGRTGFFEGHYSPLYGNSGEIVGGFCIIRDITDRRLAHDVAHEAHQRLTFHVENTPLAVVEWDSDFRVSRWSESAERLFGWKADEVLGKHVTDWRFVFAEDVNSVKQLTNKQRKGVERRGVLRNRNYTKDGKVLHCEWYNSVLNDDAGKLVSVLSLVLDVTARKQAEEEAARFLVREREARKEAENADRLKDEFLATLSHELRTPLTSVLGWATLIRQGDVDEANYAVAMETIERNARLQARLIDDLLDVSRIITGNLRLELSPMDLGPVVEAARDAVRPAAEAKGIQLLTTFDPQACTIKGDPNRLRQVVWNLLLNAIKFTPREGRVSADLRCANSSVLLTVTDSGEGIEPEFLPHAFDRFRQAEGSISRRQGGLGLGLAVVRHLVELHGGSVSAKSPGKGLGATFTVELPLAAKSENTPESHSESDAESMAVSVGVSPAGVSETAQHQHESQHAQRGSRRGANAQKIAATETNDATQSATKLPTENATELTGVRVLVVEDDEDARTLIGTMLERSGAVVISASSATEALQALEVESPATPINVLVSDIGMAGEDGYDLIRKVRLLAPERGGLTPAIALTGYASQKDRAQAIAAGYQAHIAKPIEPAEIVSAVAKLVISDK